MNGGHLSDETIQALALDERYDDAAVAAHLAGCETCREAVASYRLLFSDIAGMPAPGFDFDVKAIVLPQLAMQQMPEAVPQPLPTAASGSVLKLVFGIVFIAMLVFAGAAYVFLGDIGGIFDRSLPYLLYCIGPAAALVLVWMLRDVLHDYRQRMKRLEYY